MGDQSIVGSINESMQQMKAVHPSVDQSKPSPMELRYEDLQNAIDSLGSEVTRFIEVLKPVMGPDYADSDSRTEDPLPEESILSALIRKETARVIRIEQMLYQARNRLEI
jgi:hypothetical protein